MGRWEKLGSGEGWKDGLSGRWWRGSGDGRSEKRVIDELEREEGRIEVEGPRGVSSTKRRRRTTLEGGTTQECGCDEGKQGGVWGPS